MAGEPSDITMAFFDEPDRRRTHQEQPSRRMGGGCTECKDKCIPNFSQLVGGEHLEMRGHTRLPFRCCHEHRTCYNHHAIVDVVHLDTITDDGLQATVSLLHIPTPSGKIVKSDMELDVVRDKVRQVEYEKKKHDLHAVRDRAMQVVDKEQVSYGVLTRNCEHFCTIAAVGNKDIDTNLTHSRSQQARNCWYGIVHCLCLGNRFAGSLIGFFLYFAMVTSDDIIDIVPRYAAREFASYCGSINYTNATNGPSTWRHQRCHLTIQAIVVCVYLIYVVTQTHFFVSEKLTCRRCKLKNVFSLWFRFFLYLLIEGLLIGFEHKIFKKIRNYIMNLKNQRSLNRFILVLIAFLKSLIECIIIFWLANFVTTFLPRYWVKKYKLTTRNVQTQIHRGDVISFKQTKCDVSVDAIVTNVNETEDKDTVTLDVIYQYRCRFWMCCFSFPITEATITVDRAFVRVYDFSDYAQLYSPDEVVNNARNAKESWLCFCFRSNIFCHNAKVKNITCRERFNTCEWCCKLAFCC